MFTKQFWLETLERAIKTAAQFGLLAWGTTTFTAVGDVVNVAQGVAFALLFGLGLSVLTSVASVAVGPKGSPSLVRETPEAPDA